MIEQASKKLALKKHTGTVINARLSDFKLDKAGSAINVDSRGISHIIYTYLASSSVFTKTAFANWLRSCASFVV